VLAFKTTFRQAFIHFNYVNSITAFNNTQGPAFKWNVKTDLKKRFEAYLNKVFKELSKGILKRWELGIVNSIKNMYWNNFPINNFTNGIILLTYKMEYEHTLKHDSQTKA